MKKDLEKYWQTHRETIMHLAEQWGISVTLSLTEQQHGIEAAADLFLEEARRRGL